MTKPQLELSKDLHLPANAVTQKFGILGRSGSGKSYAAGKLAEELLDVGAQVVVLDPVGVWYGLRLDADGKRPGFPIPVLGGLRGDIPLEAGAGALVADLVVDKGTSAILDVSMFRKGDRKRFATDFAEQLFHRKKSARSPIHVIVEEAQVFVPQRAMGDEARLLGAFEDLLKLGRNFGIGSTLISQRPQSVNKDALNQAECLLVFQTNGTQERKALKEWVVDQGMDVNLLDELPGLAVGTAYVWSPQWLRVLRKVRIGKKRTYNASATPELGEKVVSRELAPVDLEQLQVAMKDVVARASETDPKSLRKRVAELEAQLRKAQGAAPAERLVPVSVVEPEHLERLEKVSAELVGAIREARALARPEEVARRIDALAAGRPAPSPAPSQRAALRVVPSTESAGGLGAGERRMLGALAMKHPEPLSRAQLGVLSGYAASGGTFRTYLPTLKRLGLVEQNGDTVRLTAEGVTAAGDAVAAAPRSPEAVQEMWRGALGQGERKMLDVLIQAYPDSMTRGALGAMSGYAAGGGTFRTYLPKLKRLGLVEVKGDEVRASDSLFMGGAA